MSEAMSTCASCSRKFPTAPPDHIHKCVCGGKMVPDTSPLGMSGGVPAGWVLVPVEPTLEMVEACAKADAETWGPVGGMYRAMWSAMLAATPTPPIEGRDADVERVARAIAKIAHNGRVAEEGYWADPCTGCNEYRVMARAALQALGERG